MTDIAEDLKKLLPVPHIAGHQDDEPFKDEEFLWVYEPPEHPGEQGKVHVLNAETDDSSIFPSLEDVATHVHHPDRQEGYAYAIRGGWRITTSDHKKVEDNYIKRLILAALRNESPPAPLPHIRQHGDPGQ